MHKKFRLIEQLIQIEVSFANYNTIIRPRRFPDNLLS